MSDPKSLDSSRDSGEGHAAREPSDSTENAAQVPLRTIGRYEVERQLGKGGFGFVYLAWDPKLLRHVAIKVPRWDKPLSVSALERFLNEGQLLAQVEHAAVATVHDVNVTEDGVPFVVMQYIEGRSLSECIRSRQMSLEQKLETLVQIAEALQHAHQQGITHRDVKPANVIIDAQQRVRLVDFGLALHDDLAIGDDEQVGVLGTPSYMAPEQVRGENHLIDGRTDVWALGVTMYVLLVGALPFRGHSYAELLRAICYKAPRPLRQIDENLPRELERICLRCLQKLMDERYQSMADLVRELRAFITESDTAGRAADVDLSGRPSIRLLETIVSPNDALDGQSNRESARLSAASKSSSMSDGASGSSGPFAIIPKGLRQFDQNDREFFLRLLPGPVDRQGIPDSIRFWLSRLGVVDQVEEVPIGLIYGPSGCGKSSFVRAGLLPRLPDRVLPVYVDCTAEHLAEFSVERVRRAIHDVPPNVSLAELLRRVRQGEMIRSGDKLLLVLDQFEQWLHRCDDYHLHPLTAALRQCDGERVQALLLIRDDFWMSATQLLRCLERKIEDGKNALALPLFDERHARRVLEALGRAYGALPADGKSLSPSQLRFIRQAVRALTQRGKVICVHLAVLAETIKGRDWGQLDYRAAGGWEGIGREYIVGVFNDLQTPTYIKRHADEAWLILQALLPESAPYLKGRLVRRIELRQRAGLEKHRERFDQLMHFLEFDARLLSPMEDEDALENGEDSPSSRDSDQTLYGLTHDFLVAPIRAWGAAKSNESRRGRAESLLRQLNDQWTMTGDSRFLPSIWDFARIGWFAGQEAKRDAPAYWRAAKWRFQKWLAVGVLLAIALSAVLWGLQSQFRNLAERAAWERTLVGDAETFDRERENVQRVSSENLARLRELARSENPTFRVRANSILAYADPLPTENWTALLRDVSLVDQEEFATIWRPLQRHPETMLTVVSEEWRTTSDLVLRSRIAILAGHLGDYRMLQTLCGSDEHPEWRTVLIHELPRWHGELGKLLTPLALDIAALDGDLVSGLCCALSLMELSAVSSNDRSSCVTFLEQAYSRHASSGAHYAAYHALDKWGLTMPLVSNIAESDRSWRIVQVPLDEARGTYVEIPMALVSAGKFELGGGDVRWQFQPEFVRSVARGIVEHDYFIACFECPAILVRAFFEDHPEFDDDSGLKERLLAMNTAQGDRIHFPAEGVTRQLACAFLNWLNKRMGYPEPYMLNEQGSYVRQHEFDCFRLPTFDEFEWALRARSKEKYFFGNSDLFLATVVGFGKHTRPARSGLFMPNRFGLFDMVSNCYEWVEETVDGLGIVKGGKSGGAPTEFASASAIVFPEYACHQIGFRVVFCPSKPR